MRMWTLRRPEGRDAQRRDELIKVLGGDATLGLPGTWFFWANPYDIITAWRKVGIAGNKLAPEMIDRSEFIDQPAPMAELATPGAEPASPRVTRKRAADLAMTPEGMVSGSLESERAKVQRLLGHAQELEAMADAPFDPTAAGVLVPDVVTRPDKEGPGGGRKRLTAMHGSVTMQGVGEEAEQREREAKELAAAVKAKKLQAAEKKEAAAAAVSERDAGFALCEVVCACEVTPCPYAKWKRCPACGPKNGLCKVRACVAARKPLLLGYTPPVGLLEGPTEAMEGVDGAL